VESGSQLVAQIELMFSHIDQNFAGAQFPAHNFVFTEQFTELLEMYRLNTTVAL
jgi:3-hydroxyacyl-[acyl-carrier-protein] dehydratase